MSILREIDLRNLRIEERTDAFDYRKTDISDFLFAQPRHDYAPLQRGRQSAELFHRKIHTFCFGTLRHHIDPSFFLSGNGGRAPNGNPNVSTELLFDVGNDAATKPVAQRD